MKHVLLLPLLLLTVASMAAPAQPECAHRTGHNASLILVEPEARGVHAGDALQLLTPDGRCVAGATAHGGNQALAVWESDPTTAAVDGAIAGDVLTLQVHRSGLLFSAETLAEPYGRDAVYELAAPPPDTLLAILDAIHAELLEAVEYIETLEAENAALAAELAELEAEIAPLQVEIANLNEQVDQLTADLAAAHEALAPLEELIDAATVRALESYQLLFSLDFPAGPGESP